MRVWVLLIAVLASGCATKSDEVAATYVSPYQFENMTCPQIAEESQRIAQRANELAGVQDSKRTKDTVATTVAVVVFWPAAFLVGGDDRNTAELARLRGEMQALEQVAIRKRCNIQFQRPSAG
ncbi:hypothetical protein CCR97_15160 [Rhodoplanes elegans]|uniref:Lipoprotein n=1 Tax=Rhodoplanes elegans TaxID=29408 RepID=A0A327KFV6_9BRAD|nr:hypothetical protein [Rhodoplanes elegans]MBK5959534.1 hypothetical protein [Rhodoplanes elegans]RAI36445.1 hypothetical protein CH338_17595 [Rhodoplanes elegans]